MRTNEICLLVMRGYIKTIPKYTKISAHSVRFSTKLTINRHSLNMVNIWGIFHVSPAILKYLLRYEQMSITFRKIHLLTKNNDM